MGKKIALIGGGGLAQEMIEVARLLEHEIVGVFAKNSQKKHHELSGYLPELLSQRDNIDGVIIAFGAVNADGIIARQKMITWLEKNKIPVISLVSPLATISPSAVIGQGCYIAHHALVSAHAIIGNHACINHYATIGHDVVLEENVCLAPQAFIGGNVVVESGVMIGADANIKQGLNIKQGSVIGMGALVLKSTLNNSLTISPKC